ncbi:hypothetical protein V866_007093 [Kwoniella sp. B9012]
MSRKRPYDLFHPNYQEDMLFPPPNKKSRNGPAPLPQGSQMTGTCTLHHFQVFIYNSFEAQLAQPVFRRLAPRTSLLPHWECETAPSTNEVNHGSKGNRLFPHRVDSAPSKQVRLSFPPPVAPTRSTASASASDPHTQYCTPLKSLPVDIDRIPPTSTTRGDRPLAQAHQKVDKLTRKAFRTNQELEVAQREFKALEDAGEVEKLRNQLQNANERIASIKNDITAKTIELTRYWSSKARTMQNEHEVEMKEKVDKLRYLQVKVGILENQEADRTGAIVGSTRPQTGDKAKPGRAPRGILRKPTRIVCQSGGFAPRPSKTFSDDLSAIQDGSSQTRAVPSREPYHIIKGSKKIEGSSRWNLDRPSHLNHDPNPVSTVNSAKLVRNHQKAEGDWSRKRKARQFQRSANYPSSEASQRNPEATYPLDIFDQLPDLCDLDTERDVRPEEGDEDLVNGIKMKYLVEPEAEKKPLGLDHFNRDNEVYVKKEDKLQEAIEEDALGIEEWDGFADDDGFGELDLEGYGCEEYQGFGVEEDDGFLVEEDDGLFVF